MWGFPVWFQLFVKCGGLQQLIVTPNNINAAGVVVTYWAGARKVPTEAWMGKTQLEATKNLISLCSVIFIVFSRKYTQFRLDKTHF